MEWFARQAEKNPALLQRPGLLREAWQAMRELVADLQTRIGLKAHQGRALDDQVQDIIMRARRAALKGGNAAQQMAPSASPPIMATPQLSERN